MYIALFLSFLCGYFVLRFIAKSFLPWILSYRDCINALKDLDCAKSHWFFGHLKEFTPDERGMLRRASLTKKYPKCTKFWMGPTHVSFSCHHPDLVKTLMTADIPKDAIVYRYLREWIGDGLVASSGLKWKRNRRLLASAFNVEVMKGYIAHHSEAALNMFEKWSLREQQGTVEVSMFDDVGKMAFDNLLRCFFSETAANMPESDDFLEATSYLKRVVLTRLFIPWHMFDFTFYKTETGRQYKKALGVTHSFTERTVKKRMSLIQQRGSGDSSNPDFLSILLQAKDSDGTGLTNKEICDEIDTFLLAGHDTVASAMSWAFYNLAKYPKLQERCRDEVKNVLGKKEDIQWSHLSKLSYLTMFIKESLRLFPPGAVVSRKLCEPLTFSRGFGSDQHNLDSLPTPDASRTLPKGSNVQVDIIMLHRNPHVWKEPNKFDPDRFTPEMVAERSPYAFMPFSSGQRNCIGQTFAMNVIKVVMALGLVRYRFAVDNSFPVPEVMLNITLNFKTGIHLKAERLI